MRVRPALASLLGALALAGCGTASGPESATPDYDAALRQAPPPLAALYTQGGKLLDGELPAYERRIEALAGHPVVVNFWASWCGPCRIEFPTFQRESARLGEEVAFLGVDVDDDSAAARTFLDEYPVPYPSYSDPDRNIFQDVASQAPGLPATAFYDASGERTYVHIGPYESDATLAADVRRYTR